ncbi:hypothetical protein [Clostridioides sp. ZZV15-6597]|uniref:hypothetical protein n=1 Tax=Clostridioides sp. ZZV15-6597 TaxID=2811500 RepID=UPI001D10B56A|nr:hypothetical protein [Clostridioides sp. ZZV15-6597]
MKTDVYELGFKLGKAGVFSSGQRIQMNNLFFQECNTDKLLHMILEGCRSQNLTVCESLIDNLYDLEIKSNFLVGLQNGSLDPKKS